MSKYLYGAAVQGIQEFIFKTNKLAEIVGASEIVEKICTTTFSSYFVEFNEENLIIGAAGNIKYVFDSEEVCKKVVLGFPKKVMEMAPGITISQALIPLEDKNLVDAIDDLEKSLKAQRNIPAMPIETGYAVLERSRRTGGVAVERKDNDYRDEATRLKINEDSRNLYKKFTGLSSPISNDNITYEFSEIANKNRWLAVIHADGNGLGKIVQNFGKNIRNEILEKQIETYRTFSEKLEESTKAASKLAFEKVVKSDKELPKYPVRPIILGGDDITLVIRGDLALDFTEEYLKEFEKQCRENFKEKDWSNQITACAGIAYIKETYPFHYGVELADKLCKEAKKFSKSKFGTSEIPSSLSFFKVQDSFIEEELKEIRKRTQLARGGVNYHYGPYLIHPKNEEASVNKLLKMIVVLKTEAEKNNKDKAVSKLRQLVSESFKNRETTKFMLERMESVNKIFFDELKKVDQKLLELSPNGTNEDDYNKSIIFDAIQIYTI